MHFHFLISHRELQLTCFMFWFIMVCFKNEVKVVLFFDLFDLMVMAAIHVIVVLGDIDVVLTIFFLLLNKFGGD